MTNNKSWIALVIGNDQIGVWTPQTLQTLPGADIAGAIRGQDGPVILLGAPEMPSVTVPCKPKDLPLPPVQVGDLTGVAVPILEQTAPTDRIDTALPGVIGFLTLNPGWDGVLCLPGPVTHWVHVSADEIVSFQSFVTTELLRAAQSLVKRTEPEDWDETAFAQGLETAMSRPERVAALVNSARFETAPRSRLTGILVGAEIAAAKPYWLGQQVAVIGEPGAVSPYLNALQAQAVPVTQTDGPAMIRAGLTAIARRI